MASPSHFSAIGEKALRAAVALESNIGGEIGGRGEGVRQAPRTGRLPRGAAKQTGSGDETACIGINRGCRCYSCSTLLAQRSVAISDRWWSAARRQPGGRRRCDGAEGQGG